MKTGPKPKPLLERFEEKYIAEPNTGCWLWLAAVNAHGYGVIGQGPHDGPMILAHRVSWNLFNGPIPPGLCVLHKCDVPRCVNPQHLFLGTIADNSLDMARKGRSTIGSRNPMAKLTESQVMEIRMAPGTQQEIGRRFGVTQTLVGLIKRREIWKSVP